MYKDLLKIIPSHLLSDYLQKVPSQLKENFEMLHDAEISGDGFSFYASVASVFSSKIEGEEIELDSYVKHKKFGVKFLPDYTKKTDDLYAAYQFARQAELTEENIVAAHKLLSQQGRLRKQNMYVSTPDGKIEYVAASPYEVEEEMQKFYSDVDLLLKTEMAIEEVFFYAAMIHLVFIKIHPWNDGNGRSARLIERWFLAQKLGEKAWFVQSEKYYYNHHNIYYSNIRLLGLEYVALDYSKALPFLMMLPKSIIEVQN